MRGAGTAVGALPSLHVTCFWLDHLSHSVKFLSFHIHPEGQDQIVSITGVPPSSQGRKEMSGRPESSYKRAQRQPSPERITLVLDCFRGLSRPHPVERDKRPQQEGRCPVRNSVEQTLSTLGSQASLVCMGPLVLRRRDGRPHESPFLYWSAVGP